MSKLAMAAGRMATLGEFFEFLWTQKLWWMIPVFAVVFGFGLLLVVAHGSALAPFVYALF
jgi:formate/nitrite transporter FocA (FNT family)